MTLRSESSIHILDLLCEGTIEGWGSEKSNPEESLKKKGTFLNETSAVNFDSVHVDLRNGTYDQDLPQDEGIKIFTQTSVGVEVGETTKDGLFTLLEGECFGACADAPVLLLNNDQMHSWMDKAKCEKLITELKEERLVENGRP